MRSRRHRASRPLRVAEPPRARHRKQPRPAVVRRTGDAMKLRANAVKVTSAMVHRSAKLVKGAVVPGAQLPAPAKIEIDAVRSGGVYLYHHDAAGRCIADTWHANLDEAKEQARFEFEIEAADWIEVANDARERHPPPDLKRRNREPVENTPQLFSRLPRTALDRAATPLGVESIVPCDGLLKLPPQRGDRSASMSRSSNSPSETARASCSVVCARSGLESFSSALAGSLPRARPHTHRPAGCCDASLGGRGPLPGVGDAVDPGVRRRVGARAAGGNGRP